MRHVLCGFLLLLALAVVTGLVYARVLAPSAESADTAGFVCPLTGEELPCPDCCPLNATPAEDAKPAGPACCPVTDQ